MFLTTYPLVFRRMLPESSAGTVSREREAFILELQRQDHVLYQSVWLLQYTGPQRLSQIGELREVVYTGGDIRDFHSATCAHLRN